MIKKQNKISIYITYTLLIILSIIVYFLKFKKIKVDNSADLNLPKKIPYQSQPKTKINKSESIVTNANIKGLPISDLLRYDEKPVMSEVLNTETFVNTQNIKPIEIKNEALNTDITDISEILKTNIIEQIETLKRIDENNEISKFGTYAQKIQL